MQFFTATSPHLHGPNSTPWVMRQVVYALLPGAAALSWFFGWGPLINILFATAAGLGLEALVLLLRRKPLSPEATDFSTVITCMVLAMAAPPLLPWWATLTGVFFAVVVAKQLYGGLGQNPFNPAMVGYVVLLISFPREMTSWLPPLDPEHHFLTLPGTLSAIFTSTLPNGVSVDAITAASPLDTMKTRLGTGQSVGEVLSLPSHGLFGGLHWEWVEGAFMLGGVWMVYRRVITWHTPAAMIGALFLISMLFFFIDPDRFAPPTFHLFSGAAMLGAFFIASDPVTGSTTPMGRFVFAGGIGLLTYVIRTWGGYPDGVAFAVVIMNMMVPTIDHFTQPRVYGRRDGQAPR